MKKKQSKRSKNARSAAQRIRRRAAPVAVSYRTVAHPTSRRSVRFKRREFVRSVDVITGAGGPSDYQYLMIQTNPGISSAFPWLSAQAAGYQQYRFHSLRYEYIPRVGTSESGALYMAAEYDVDQGAPQDEKVISAYDGCVEDNLWQKLALRVDCKGLHASAPRRYIRTSTDTTGEKYDGAIIYIATQGAQSAKSYGKIWVDYDIELFIPQREPTQPADTGSASWTIAEPAEDLGYSSSTPLNFQNPLFDNLKGYLTPYYVLGAFAGWKVLNSFFGRTKVSVPVSAGSTDQPLVAALSLNVNGAPVASTSSTNNSTPPSGFYAQDDIVLDFAGPFAAGDIIDVTLSNIANALPFTANLISAYGSAMWEYYSRYFPSFFTAPSAATYVPKPRILSPVERKLLMTRGYVPPGAKVKKKKEEKAESKEAPPRLPTGYILVKTPASAKSE